jgi:hypothetical protein
MPTQAIDFSSIGGRPVSDGSSAPAAPIDFSSIGGKQVSQGAAQEQAPPPGQTPGASNITGISAQPQDKSIGDKLSTWASNVADDIKNGTDKTGVGTVLQKLGAHGVYNGNSQAVGDFMASLPLGLARMAKGAGEVTPGSQASTWQGTKDVVGGAMDAATIPSAFLGGPAAEGSAAAADAAASKVFGNAERAGQLFNEVKQAAGNVPVDVTDEMSQAASRIQELSDAGAKGMPRVITKFVSRVTDPDKPQITYDQARDFYTNVSRLSSSEYQNMSPQMSAAVSRFAGAFKDSIRASADSMGAADKLDQAMQLWGTAKSWQQFGSEVWTGFKRGLPWGAGAGAGAATGSFAIKKLTDLLGGQ